MSKIDMTELKIRYVKSDDLAELQQLFVDTISAICSKDYNKAQIHVWTASINNTQRWHDIISNQICLLAETGDKIIGFGTLKHGSHIDMLYVHKDFQRKGVASRLFSNLEKEAISQHKTSLTSDVSKTARPFFEKKGFTGIEEQFKIIQGVEISNYKMLKEL
jgi:putative acetyltransferase